MEQLYLTRMVAADDNPLSLDNDFRRLITSRRCLLMDYRAKNGGDYGVVSFDANDNAAVLASVNWEGREPAIVHEDIIKLPVAGRGDVLTSQQVSEFNTKIDGRFTLAGDLAPRAGDDLETWLSYLLRLASAHDAGKDFRLGGYVVRTR